MSNNGSGPPRTIGAALGETPSEFYPVAVDFAQAAPTDQGALASESPQDWVNYLRTQHANLVQAVGSHATSLAARNREAGYNVVRSADDPEFVSGAIANILRQCYGGTFPIKEFTDADFLRAQIDAGMITSLVLRDEVSGQPVGTSSLRHFNKEEWRAAYAKGSPIGVELARSASVPSGGSTMELMQARQVHLFENPDMLGSHALVHVDSRASVGRTLPGGEYLQGGAKTQHSTFKNGLRPTFLHASYDFKGTYEPMFQYSMAFDRDGQRRYAETHPLYIPRAAEGLAEFGQDVLDLAELPATIVAVEEEAAADARLCVTDNGAYMEGTLPHHNQDTVSIAEAAAMVNHPDMQNGLMVKIAATRENVATMQALIDHGFVATGIIPGTATKLVSPEGALVAYSQPHYAIYTINKRGVLADAPGLEVPRDIEDHPIATSVQRLWSIMRERNQR